MAKTLVEFPRRLGRPKGSIWDTFMDGQVWKLTLEDAPHIASLRQLGNRLRTIASLRGFSTHCSVFDDCVVFQVRPRKPITLADALGKGKEETL